MHIKKKKLIEMEKQELKVQENYKDNGLVKIRNRTILGVHCHLVKSVSSRLKEKDPRLKIVQRND